MQAPIELIEVLVESKCDFQYSGTIPQIPLALSPACLTWYLHEDSVQANARPMDWSLRE